MFFSQVCQANTGLSAHNTPVLHEIFLLLEPLTKAPSASVRSLAREARMVMTTRLASALPSQDVTTTSKKQGEEDSLQTYQKALTLLQDPLLPVRAHGLMLLRQLVLPHPPSRQPSLEPALVPGVLSIFLQSLQDEDSYMFLNAVQGLAAMVDGFGKEVLKGLMNDYASGLDGSGGIGLTQSDVDMRVRIGEALGQVIRRCDEALPLHSMVCSCDAIVQLFLMKRVFSRSRYSSTSIGSIGSCITHSYNN
jgi:Required for nuclear transport of RNA pol II C-terminus 1